MSARRVIALASVALMLVPLVIRAQDDQLPRSTMPSWLAFGLHGIGSDPVGAFADNVRSAWGGGVEGRVRLDPDGWLALRGDLSYSSYGRSRSVVGAAPGAGALIGGELATSNTISTAMIGAEVALPWGVVRPYVNAMIGANLFQTATVLRPPAGVPQNAQSTTNTDDWIASRAVGGGVRIPLARNRTGLTALDVGVRRWFNGPTRYATPADLVAGPAGPSLRTRESRTDAWAFSVGFAFAP